MKHIKTALLSITILFTQLVVAQELLAPINIQSPNAGNLGQYGDVPVSLYTGNINISIPIYSLNANNIPLDITLNYDATGVRIDQHPGWVGQNWSLIAGGVITRSIQGHADEWIEVRIDGDPLYNGYMYRGSDLTQGQLENDEAFRGYADQVAIHKYDYLPDIFTFNFMGKSGKFFLGEDGIWKVSSEDNLKVIMEPELITPLFESFGPNYYNGKPFMKVIGGFKLIDDSGNTYIFGYNSESESGREAIEYSIDFFNHFVGNMNWRANAWYLTKVIDKNGKEVYNFEYSRKYYVAEFFRSIYDKKYSMDATCFWLDLPGCWFNSEGDCYTDNSIDADIVSGSLISPVYLNKINSISGESVTFIRDDKTTQKKVNQDDLYHTYKKLVDDYQYGDYLWIFYLQQSNPYIDQPLTDDYLDNLFWAKLKHIKVTNNTSPIKLISFNYNDNPDERLCLQSVDVRMQQWPYNQSDKLTYKFGYNRFSEIPDYLSRKVDHWGYNNGRNYGVDLESIYYNHFVQREPNPEFTSIGSLSYIIYPTGGWSYFSFEPNFYDQVVSDNRSSLYNKSGIGGGQRIKKITNYDGVSTETTEYIYRTNYQNGSGGEHGSGILKAMPKYYWDKYQLRWYNNGTRYDYFASTFSNNSLIPLSNSYGTSVSYSEVVEKKDDNSLTISKFSNFSNDNPFYFDEQPLNTFFEEASVYTPYSELSLLRGKLLEQNLYDNDFKVVMENEFIYRFDHNTMFSNYVLATDARTELACPTATSMIGVPNGNAFKIYYFDYDLMSKSTKHYFGDSYITESTSYTKRELNTNNFLIRQLIEEVKLTGIAEYLKTNYYYPADFSNENLMTQLISSCRHSEIVKTIVKQDNKPVSYKKVNYREENSMIVRSSVETARDEESDDKVTLFYDKYDINGNLSEFHYDKDKHTCIVWGYRNQVPIVKLDNVEYLDIESYVDQIVTKSDQDISSCFNSEACTETELRELVKQLRTNLPNSMIESYTYDPGIGITSITSPNDITEYYSYGAFNQLEAKYDNEENILQAIEYNYQDETYIDLAPIDIFTDAYDIGAPVTFYCEGLIGIFGIQTFDWTLTCNNNIIETYSDNSGKFNTHFVIPGEYTIICTSSDPETGISKSKNRFFSVGSSALPFEFSNKNTSISYPKAYQSGVIVCPGFDEITFSLTNFCESILSNVTIQIGSEIYDLLPEQVLTVVIDVEKGQVIPCNVTIEGYQQNDEAVLKIESLLYHSTCIGNSDVLHIRID